MISDWNSDLIINLSILVCSKWFSSIGSCQPVCQINDHLKVWVIWRKKSGWTLFRSIFSDLTTTAATNFSRNSKRTRETQSSEIWLRPSLTTFMISEIFLRIMFLYIIIQTIFCTSKWMEFVVEVKSKSWCRF